MILVQGFVSRLILFFAVLIAVAFSHPAESETLVQDGDSLVIVGDSITQARKYSVLIETYLLTSGVAEDVDTMAHGWSGEQVSGLAERVENDVLRFKPKVVTLSYGMNDGRYKPFDPDTADIYRDHMREVVQQFKQNGSRVVIVGSPGCVDPDKFTRTAPAAIYNETLSKFADIAQQVAGEEGVKYAAVNQALSKAQQIAKERYGRDFAMLGFDGFHPDWAGHMVMAYAYLKALVDDYEVGRITMDYKTGAAEASEGHRVLAIAPGEVEIESKRYPFCFFGKENDPAGTRSAAELMPFNDELNNYTLVVKNAPPKCMVTWGDSQKSFTAEELEKGINLSSAFLDDNPFLDQFKKIIIAVRSKHTFEIHMVKVWVTDLPVIERFLVPNNKEKLNDFMDTILQERQRHIDGIKDLIVPIRHAIKIEALPAASDD